MWVLKTRVRLGGMLLPSEPSYQLQPVLKDVTLIQMMEWAFIQQAVKVWSVRHLTANPVCVLGLEVSLFTALFLRESLACWVVFWQTEWSGRLSIRLFLNNRVSLSLSSCGQGANWIHSRGLRSSFQARPGVTQLVPALKAEAGRSLVLTPAQSKCLPSSS